MTAGGVMYAPTRYERVTFTDGKTSRTVLLREPSEARSGQLVLLRGVEVDRHGRELSPAGHDVRVRVIDVTLVRRRVRLRLNLRYEELEPMEDER